MLDELMILARIKEGDIKAFEGIFRRYYSPLCWYAAGITGDTASAEEIVEELISLSCIMVRPLRLRIWHYQFFHIL